MIESGQTTFYVSKDKGYYTAENLDVKFEMGSRELNPVKMVVTEQDTFGVLGGPDTGDHFKPGAGIMETISNRGQAGMALS